MSTIEQIAEEHGFKEVVKVKGAEHELVVEAADHIRIDRDAPSISSGILFVSEKNNIAFAYNGNGDMTIYKLNGVKK